MSDVGNDVFGLVAKRIFIGTSAIIGVTVFNGLNSVLIKYAGGGSLEIGGATLTWGNGYLFNTTEAVSINARGTFYCAATGGTALIMVLSGRTAGFGD